MCRRAGLLPGVAQPIRRLRHEFADRLRISSSSWRPPVGRRPHPARFDAANAPPACPSSCATRRLTVEGSIPSSMPARTGCQPAAPGQRDPDLRNSCRTHPHGDRGHEQGHRMATNALVVGSRRGPQPGPEPRRGPCDGTDASLCPHPADLGVLTLAPSPGPGRQPRPPAQTYRHPEASSEAFSLDLQTSFPYSSPCLGRPPPNRACRLGLTRGTAIVSFSDPDRILRRPSGGRWNAPAPTTVTYGYSPMTVYVAWNLLRAAVRGTIHRHELRHADLPGPPRKHRTGVEGSSAEVVTGDGARLRWDTDPQPDPAGIEERWAPYMKRMINKVDLAPGPDRHPGRVRPRGIELRRRDIRRVTR